MSFVVTAYELQSIANIGADFFVNGNLITGTIEVKLNDLIEFKVNNNSVCFTEDSKLYQPFTPLLSKSPINFNLTFNSDRTIGTVILNTEFTELYFRVKTELKKSELVNTGNVYIIEREKISELNKLRDYKYSHQESFITIDLGIYIVNLFSIPFIVPDNYQESENSISLGGHEIDLQGKLINNDVIKIKIGEFNIVGEFNNSLDYVNTDIKLFVPYCEEIILEPIEVINKKVEIFFTLNVYSSLSSVDVFSDGIIISSSNIIISKNVPLSDVIDGTGAIINQSINDFRDNKGNEECFIKIERGDVLINNLNPTINDFSTLENIKGFIKINNINLVSNCTDLEKNEIKNILLDGVLIK